jgi:hypothetical protein
MDAMIDVTTIGKTTFNSLLTEAYEIRTKEFHQKKNNCGMIFRIE